MWWWNVMECDDGPIDAVVGSKNDRRRPWANKWKRSLVVVWLLSHAWLIVIPWTVACQVPPSMGISGKNTGVCCHFFLQGIFQTQGFNSYLLHYRRILDLWAYREGSSRGPRKAFRSWKRGRNRFSPGHLVERQSADILLLALWDPFLTFNLRTIG